jgi:inward rectifier potassium channel
MRFWRFLVLLRAETFAQTVHARHEYGADDVAWNVRFVDILLQDPDGTPRVDYGRFHEVESA